MVKSSRLPRLVRVFIAFSLVFTVFTLSVAGISLIVSSQPQTSLFTSVQSSAVSNQAKILPVPYFSQGATNWCFHSSLSMVLQSRGKDVQPRDIAGFLGHGSDHSMSLLDIIMGRVDSYVSQFPDLTLERGYSAWSFNDYKAHIDAVPSEPVIVSSFNLPFGNPGHTVVVVGYLIEDGKQFLYLHDPSGYLTGKTVKYAKVSWEQFEELSRLAWSQVVIRRTANP